jgi:hypothetical protein
MPRWAAKRAGALLPESSRNSKVSPLCIVRRAETSSGLVNGSIGLRALGSFQWNSAHLDRTCKRLTVVEAKNLPAVIDKQIEMFQEIVSEHSPDAGVFSFQLRQILYDCQNVCCRISPNFD